MEKCVVITGSNRGIGKAIAIEFAKAGYHLVLHYYQHQDEVLQLKKELEKDYQSNILIIQADLSKEEEIQRFSQEVTAVFPKIDVLVNNAGIALDCLLEDKTKENFIKTLEVNTIAPFLLSRLLAPSMSQGGSIIMIASTNAIDTFYPESLDYDASKAALLSITHNLAKAYAPYIRVNSILPGWVDTPMNDNLDDEFIKQEKQHILLQRFAQSEEIAKVVFFVASEAASYINDSMIRVDGGLL